MVIDMVASLVFLTSNLTSAFFLIPGLVEAVRNDSLGISAHASFCIWIFAVALNWHSSNWIQKILYIAEKLLDKTDEEVQNKFIESYEQIIQFSLF